MKIKYRVAEERLAVDIAAAGFEDRYEYLSLSAIRNHRTQAGIRYATLELVTHELAHAADMGLPLQVQEASNIGQHIAKLGIGASDFNEIRASAITYLVMRQVCAVRELRQGILRGCMRNLHKYTHLENAPKIISHEIRRARSRELAETLIQYFIQRETLIPV